MYYHCIIILVTPKYSTTLWHYLQNNDDLSINSLIDRLEMLKKIIQGKTTESYNHFDIKPTNIFINETEGKWNGDLVLADFGIGEVGFTTHGCGTSGFASPEQISSEAGSASDTYSIGKGKYKLKIVSSILKF